MYDLLPCVSACRATLMLDLGAMQCLLHYPHFCMVTDSHALIIKGRSNWLWLRLAGTPGKTLVGMRIESHWCTFLRYFNPSCFVLLPFWLNSMLLCSSFFLPSFLILLYSCTLLSTPLSSLLFSAVFPLLSKDTQLWLGWTKWLLEVDFIYHCGTNSCPSSLLPWEPLNLQ